MPARSSAQLLAAMTLQPSGTVFADAAIERELQACGLTSGGACASRREENALAIVRRTLEGTQTAVSSVAWAGHAGRRAEQSGSDIDQHQAELNRGLLHETDFSTWWPQR